MKKLALSLAVALAIPGPALAASQLFAERANVIASGDTLQLFGLPAIDAAGNVKYFDTTIVLKHGDNGKPKRQAVVRVTPTPDVDPMGFVPGTYADENVTCELVKAPFGGQTEVIVNCVDDVSAKTAEVVVYTGPIASNPSAAILIEEQADQIPGTEQYAWGLTTDHTGGGTFGGCIDNGYITTARQIGDLLVLIRWNANNPVAQACSLNLVRVAP